MRIRTGLFLVLTAASLLAAENSVAGPEKFPAKGFIKNAAGDECWYQQQVIHGSHHFLGDSIANTIGEIVFDEPQCMRDSGTGLSANEILINSQISTWYSHPDADFDTQNLRKSSLYQVVGKCMQSKNFTPIW